MTGKEIGKTVKKTISKVIKKRLDRDHEEGNHNQGGRKPNPGSGRGKRQNKR